MTRNKHKRKASVNPKPNKLKGTQSLGVIALHPKIFVVIGLLFIALGISLLVFNPQDNAMFGLSMLSIFIGVVISFYAKFPATKIKTN